MLSEAPYISQVIKRYSLDQESRTQTAQLPNMTNLNNSSEQ